MRLISDIKNDHFEPINFIQVNSTNELTPLISSPTPPLSQQAECSNTNLIDIFSHLQYTALHSLKRWSELNRSSLTAPIAYTSLARQSSPFPYRDEVNSRFILWEGDISLLNADAIVNTTNETLSDSNSVSNRIVSRAGPGLLEELKTIKGILATAISDKSH